MLYIDKNIHAQQFRVYFQGAGLNYRIGSTKIYTIQKSFIPKANFINLCFVLVFKWI